MEINLFEEISNNIKDIDTVSILNNDQEYQEWLDARIKETKDLLLNNNFKEEE